MKINTIILLSFLFSLGAYAQDPHVELGLKGGLNVALHYVLN